MTKDNLFGKEFFSLPSLYLQNGVKGAGNILDEQKITSVGTISVEGELLSSHQLIRELWDQFLGELMGSVHIVSTSDQARQLETAEVGLDQEFGAGLGGGVRVGGFQDVFFGHGIRFKIFPFPIDLIGRNVNESLEGFAILGTLEKNVRSHNVGMSKGQRVSERVVDVGLGSKVHDGVDFVFEERIVDNVRRGNVTLDEFEVGKVIDLVEIFQTTAVIQAVKNDNVVLGVLLTEQNCNMGGNETYKRYFRQSFKQRHGGVSEIRHDKIFHSTVILDSPMTTTGQIPRPFSNSQRTSPSRKKDVLWCIVSLFCRHFNSI